MRRGFIVAAVLLWSVIACRYPRRRSHAIFASVTRALAVETHVDLRRAGPREVEGGRCRLIGHVPSEAAALALRSEIALFLRVPATAGGTAASERSAT